MVGSGTYLFSSICKKAESPEPVVQQVRVSNSWGCIGDVKRNKGSP